MDKTDEELILECQEGSQDALHILFLRYQHLIFNFCSRILGNRADAEDVTGEIFLMLSSKQKNFRPEAKFSTWLYTVARNACISKMRKRKSIFPLIFQINEEGSEKRTFDIPDPKPTPYEEAHKKEAASFVKKAIGSLPVAQKEAIVLREYHDLSYDEIAAILQISLENVKILIFRARESLRKELAPVLKENEQ